MGCARRAAIRVDPPLSLSRPSPSRAVSRAQLVCSTPPPDLALYHKDGPSYYANAGSVTRGVQCSRANSSRGAGRLGTAMRRHGDAVLGGRRRGGTCGTRQDRKQCRPKGRGSLLRMEVGGVRRGRGCVCRGRVGLHHCEPDKRWWEARKVWALRRGGGIRESII
jgi:hypothetical protein